MGIATFLSTPQHRLNKKTNVTLRPRFPSVKVPNSCSSDEFSSCSTQSNECCSDSVRRILNFGCEAPSSLSRAVVVYSVPPFYPKFEDNDIKIDLDGVYEENNLPPRYFKYIAPQGDSAEIKFAPKLEFNTSEYDVDALMNRFNSGTIREFEAIAMSPKNLGGGCRDPGISESEDDTPEMDCVTYREQVADVVVGVHEQLAFDSDAFDFLD